MGIHWNFLLQESHYIPLVLLIRSLGGKVDVSNLEEILENMKIRLPDEKIKDLSQNLPTDGEHHRY